MSVPDYGLEALRKSVVPYTPGSKTEYQLRTIGESSVSGLRIGLENTTLIVDDTATELPAIPLLNRNSMIIFNQSTTVTVYIGNSNVTADSVVGNTSGWPIPPLSFYATDIKDTIIIYARCPTGQTAKVLVEEVA